MSAKHLSKNLLVVYGLPLMVILSSIAIALSPLLKKHPELAIGIVYDLTLLAPILFLILAKRYKLKLFLAIPVFTIGVLLSTFLLPENQQEHLDLIKTFALPMVELVVVAVFIYKIYCISKAFRLNAAKATIDFYDLSKLSANTVFGTSRFASFFASEISMLYYAFFAWRPKKTDLATFTNYKESSYIAYCGALLIVIGIESYTLHTLLIKWNVWAAWLLTITSIYTAVMVIGHIKALVLRKSVLTSNMLTLKNGLIGDIKIPLHQIKTLEFCITELNIKGKQTGNLGLSKESSNHNIAIHFKTPQTIEKPYGYKENCDVLLVHIDKKEAFSAAVHGELKKLT